MGNVEIGQFLFEKDLNERILPEWKNALDTLYKVDSSLGLVNQFSSDLKLLWKELEEKSTNEEELKLRILATKARLFSSVPHHLSRILAQLSEHAFSIMSTVSLETSINDSTIDCVRCKYPLSDCYCEEYKETFMEMLGIMSRFTILQRLMMEISIRTADAALQKHVQQVASITLHEERLPELIEWVKDNLMVWLGTVLKSLDQGQRSRLEERLIFLLHESFGEALIGQLFDIIIDFPDSTPAINDLKACVERAPLMRKLLSSLQTTISERVLHSGVNTREILLVYIQSIKSLQILDSSGAIVGVVCDLIQNYLRQRSDTVRCIVWFLTEEKHMDLNEDVMRDNVSFSDEGQDIDEEEFVEAEWNTWTPSPNNGLPSGIRGGGKSRDMISMMVGVYGSKEVFVKKYCQLLAERLIQSKDVDLVNEEKYVELLKVRFGENELQQCEVMLKDMRDSKRFHDLMVSDHQIDAWKPRVGASIMSAQYWPSKELREEKLVIPKGPFEKLVEYRKGFERLKNSRTLEYRWHLGTVALELEMGGKITRVSVTPFLASIIHLFQQKESWSLRDMCKELKASQALVRKRLSYWTMRGVLEEAGGGKLDVWELANTLPNLEKNPSALSADSTDEDEDDFNASTAFEADENELEMYWNYVRNILGLGPLKAERLHALLKNMYSSPGKPSPSLAAVNSFLMGKVKDGLLFYVNGAYKLQPKPS